MEPDKTVRHNAAKIPAVLRLELSAFVTILSTSRIDKFYTRNAPCFKIGMIAKRRIEKGDGATSIQTHLIPPIVASLHSDVESLIMMVPYCDERMIAPIPDIQQEV
jgi:hypothetical protein